MNFVEKCLLITHLSYKVHSKVSDHFPLSTLTLLSLALYFVLLKNSADLDESL